MSFVEGTEIMTKIVRVMFVLDRSSLLTHEHMHVGKDILEGGRFKRLFKSLMMKVGIRG